MYHFSPVTDRIQQMHTAIRNRMIQTDAERARITTEFVREHEAMVPFMRRPLLLKAICEQMTIRVEDFELIVGNTSQNFCGAGIDPDWDGIGWIPKEIRSGRWTLQGDGLYHNPSSDGLPMAISAEDYAYLCKIEPFWAHRKYSDVAGSWKPEGYEELCRMNVSATRPGVPILNIPSGHLTAGFRKIIERGYASIRQEAQAWLDAHVGRLMGEDAEKVRFYAAAVAACDAAEIFVSRYGTACLEKAKTCADEARRQELEQMADSLFWISKNPCRHYWEACQQAILYQHLLKISHIGDSGSFGRFDQYTWPYLRADLESGYVTREQAQEITDAFFLKINSMYTGGNPQLIQITGLGNTYLHTTLGGVDPETGRDASNPVTYMALESVGRLHLHDPTLSLRVSSQTPDALWELAIETSRLVGGLPLFQNDDVIIPGIERELGFTEHDARDYAIIGCQEITGSGNDYSAANGVCPPHSTIHYGVILNMALNNGINPMNHEQCSIHTGYLYEMQSFAEVQEAWKTLARHFLQSQVSLNNYMEYLVQYLTPHAILSISMDGCMESGKDCTAGGCKYNSYGGTGTGLATVADSLTAIRYMCFDKKLCTTRELYDAVMANWAGYEPLRQRIIAEVPHFGNHDPYADEQMHWVLTTYYGLCRECYSVRAKVFKAGLYGAADHVHQGYTTWATPDGRLAGTPIADAASPVQGRDTHGPTAVFASSLCYDHSLFMDGVCLNLRIHPSALSNEEGIQKLRDMIRVYMKNGGAEVQFNVVSSETLRAAQANPEEYRDLVVRIAGYSAYFVELTRDCQNDLIARNENML